MAVAKYTIANFNLTSKWTCGVKGEKSISYFMTGPTIDRSEKTVKYSLPSGKKITSSIVWMKCGSPSTGISSLKVAGGSKFQTVKGERGYSVNLASNSGTLKVKFEFKANGKLYPDTATHPEHSAVLNLTDIRLEIKYEDDTSSKDKKKNKDKKKQAGTLEVPPQAVCIYDQEDGSVYLFDGVTKVQHALSMDIQEEPEGKNKDKYVNNARNQPDKLTLDVLMSDVYSGGGAIVTKTGKLDDQQSKSSKATSKYLMERLPLGKAAWTRSEAAFHTLHYLKEQRHKLSVITPQWVHVDMLISTITVSDDDTTMMNGWQGQIVLQHAYEAKEVKKTNYKKDPGTGTPPTQSKSKDIIDKTKKYTYTN